MTVNHDPKHTVSMLKPLYYGGKPVVLFAGEAYNSPLMSTLAGAYNSGQEQASKIVQYLKKSADM